MVFHSGCTSLYLPPRISGFWLFRILTASTEFLFCISQRLSNLKYGSWPLGHPLNEVPVQVSCSSFYRIVCLFFFLLICSSSLYMMGKSPLSDICIAKIFSQSMDSNFLQLDAICASPPPPKSNSLVHLTTVTCSSIPFPKQ